MRIGKVEIPDGAWLAPMAGVTDMPFRSICRRMGAALTCTEMVSAKGLYYNPVRGGTLRATAPIERPVAMQLFGRDPEVMAQMARDYGNDFDIIDINMGCPAPKIVKAGQGCALMREPELACQIVREIRRNIEKPVTVKFRKGWDDAHCNYLDFAKKMEDAGASAVTIHGRTREQFYAPKADWEAIARVKEALEIPVIGNGDIFSAQDALAMLRETGCDAVMVARGAQGNPWIFSQIQQALQGLPVSFPTPREKVEIAMEHARKLCEIRQEQFGVAAMRKHMAWYLKGIPGAARLRQEIMCAETLEAMGAVMEKALLSAATGGN